MSNLLAFIYGVPGWAELLIIGFIVLLLFGKRLPAVMGSIGQSFTAFKRGIKDDGDDTQDDAAARKRAEESKTS